MKISIKFIIFTLCVGISYEANANKPFKFFESVSYNDALIMLSDNIYLYDQFKIYAKDKPDVVHALKTVVERDYYYLNVIRPKNTEPKKMDCYLTNHINSLIAEKELFDATNEDGGYTLSQLNQVLPHNSLCPLSETKKIIAPTS